MKAMLLSVGVLLLLPSSMANAKCQMKEYVFSGAVREAVSGKPIAGARVYLFLDQQDGTYSRGYATKYPDYFITDAQGKFVATSYFNTFTAYSPVTGDQCDGTPKSVEVVVVKDDYLSARAVAQVHALAVQGSSESSIRELSPVEMYK
jgi:hypothetical protein